MNCGQLVSRIIMQRPGADPALALLWLNESMRSMLNKRNWSGTRKEVICYFPQAYTTGTISVTTGSTLVTGSGTGWPVNDVVNTTITEMVQSPFEQWVCLASMQGVTRNTILLIESGGPNQEICPVLDLLGNRVKCNFQYTHSAGTSAMAGSLNGLQIRPSGYTIPVFSVMAVTSPTTLVMLEPWAQTNQSGLGYNILVMYLAIDPNIKDIVYGTDPFQNINLWLHVPQQRLNRVDPNRLAYNSPVWVSDKGPNVNGIMTYEIWPPTFIVYQLNFMINLAWPDMRIPSDTPPPFMNENSIIYGALAQGYATWCGRQPTNQDPAYSLENSMKYAQMSDQSFIDAVQADESRTQTMFTYSPVSDESMGVNYALQHAMDSDGNWLVP